MKEKADSSAREPSFKKAPIPSQSKAFAQDMPL
jgi:hypothetical protein